MEEEYAPPGFLPKRFMMVGFTFLILAHDFYAKTAMPIAMKLLIQQNAVNATAPKNTECPKLKAAKASGVYQDVRGTNYGWTKDSVPELIRYFYTSYTTVQPIFGYLADKYMCTKYLLTISLGGSSAVTLLTPFIVDSTGGNMMIVNIVRFIHGFVLSMVTPSIANTIAHWVPSKERGTLLSVTYFGLSSGLLIANTFTDTVIKSQKNWAAPFYIYGGVGMLIMVLWFILASPSPDTCPSISAEEKFYLDAEFGNTVDHGKKPVPLRHILLSRDFWLLLFVNCGYLFTYNLSKAMMATYLPNVLKFNVKSSALWRCLPDTVMGLTTLASGIFSDWAINRGYINRIVMRKTCADISMMGAVIYFFALFVASCHVEAAKLLYVMAMGLQGINFCGIRIVVFDISPNYAAVMMSFVNGVGIAPIVFMNSIINSLAPNKTIEQYRRAFYLGLGVSSISNFMFVVFVRANIQKWNTPQRKSKKEKKSLK